MNADSIDWDRACVLAGGSPAIRDQIIDGVLALFSDQGELAPLFAISPQPSDLPLLRTLSHRAVGLAKQAAMPGLEAVCKQLNACLAEGRFEDAGAMGTALREERERVRKTVVAWRGGES